MSETVVDVLEVVHIEEKQRRGPRARAADRLLEPAGQEGPVRQARERVVKRLVTELALQSLALSDVLRQGQPRLNTGELEAADDHLHVDERAVGRSVNDISHDHLIALASREVFEEPWDIALRA